MTARYHYVEIDDGSAHGEDHATAKCKTCSYLGHTFRGSRAYRDAEQDASEHELQMMACDDQEPRRGH